MDRPEQANLIAIFIFFTVIGALCMLIFSGCETIPDFPTQGMTAKEKITHYGCYYCWDSNGFCCEKQVPEYDNNIFDCENATLFSEKCTKPEGCA